MTEPLEDATIDARIPVRVEHFQLEQLDENVLLYHPGLTKTLRLNETAAVLWELCDGEHTIGEIADMLSDAYPDQADAISGDVRDTLRGLLAEGALTLV